MCGQTLTLRCGRVPDAGWFFRSMHPIPESCCRRSPCRFPPNAPSRRASISSCRLGTTRRKASSAVAFLVELLPLPAFASRRIVDLYISPHGNSGQLPFFTTSACHSSRQFSRSLSAVPIPGVESFTVVTSVSCRPARQAQCLYLVARLLAAPVAFIACFINLSSMSMLVRMRPSDV